jgi:hypothetical protein
MLILFESGGLHPGMAYVLDGEPASTSSEHALVLVAKEAAPGPEAMGTAAKVWHRCRCAKTDGG